MNTYLFPLILVLLIIISSTISLKFGISVTIIEIIIGIIVGNLGILQAENWMLFIATFGGVLLTFLAGTEIDSSLIKLDSIIIGIISFLIPFIVIFLICYFGLKWGLNVSLLSATALSETSIAVVYSVLVEKGLNKFKIGKLLMVATFITNLCTAIALNVLFMKFNINTIIFYIFSIIILLICYKYSKIIFENELFKNKINEVEVQYIIVLLFLFMFLAAFGNCQAILPIFILGAILSKQLKEINVKKHLQIISFAIVSPIFFIVAGMKVSIPLIFESLVIFIIIFGLRQIAKFIGVYSISNYYLKENVTYITLMMSTGLTFGLIAAVYGLNTGLINQTHYSILTGVLVLSAIIPSFIAERWFQVKKK